MAPGEDGSLVNHHLIHPDYMVAGLIEDNPTPLFVLAQQPVPAAAFFTDGRTHATDAEDKFHSRDGWVALRATASRLVQWTAAQGEPPVSDRAW